MTTAIAQPPVTAAHAPLPQDGLSAARTYAAIAPSTSSPRIVTPNSKNSQRVVDNASPTSSSDSSAPQQRVEGKRSPLSYVQSTSSSSSHHFFFFLIFSFVFFFFSSSSHDDRRPPRLVVGESRCLLLTLLVHVAAQARCPL